MKTLILFTIGFAVAHGAQTIRPRFDSLEECRSAAREVTVAALGLVLPEDPEKASDLLSTTFFNQPEEERFSGVTNRDWASKWSIFSDALILKAKAAGLDDLSLARCIAALNRGRNEKTIYGVCRNPPFDADEATRARLRKEDEETNRQMLEEARKEPGKFSEPDATVPVAAYFAHYKQGNCWLIVCKWECESTDGAPASLGHVRVWAVDAASGKFVAYVTCD
jgi:hypothetical protein